MTKEELEKEISMLEARVEANKTMSENYVKDLAKTKKQLADINKPELTPAQLDDVYEAIERGVSEYDFSDTGNYDKEFGIDYDGRVTLESFEINNSQELVESIVEKVSKLFVEAECPEELDTTEPDNHKVTHVEKII